MKTSTLKILLGFEIFKIVIAFANVLWLVDAYPALSAVISFVSLVTSCVAIVATAIVAIVATAIVVTAATAIVVTAATAIVVASVAGIVAAVTTTAIVVTTTAGIVAATAAASTVRSMSSDVWARLTKMASNAEGAR